jgi:hypothetical protein
MNSYKPLKVGNLYTGNNLDCPWEFHSTLDEALAPYNTWANKGFTLQFIQPHYHFVVLEAYTTTENDPKEVQGWAIVYKVLVAETGQVGWIVDDKREKGTWKKAC